MDHLGPIFRASIFGMDSDLIVHLLFDNLSTSHNARVTSAKYAPRAHERSRTEVSAILENKFFIVLSFVRTDLCMDR